MSGTSADPGTQAGPPRSALDERYARFARRFREVPGGHLTLRVVVFLVGLLFVAGGVVLIVLPGPLTIPPLLVGVYVWSFEFTWARRLRVRVLTSAGQAWQQAKAHPVRAVVITVLGLVLAAAAVWAVVHYDAVRRLHDLVR